MYKFGLLVVAVSCSKVHAFNVYHYSAEQKPVGGISADPYPYFQVDPATTEWDVSEDATATPLLSVSSKLVCIEGCCHALFAKMMKSSYSFHRIDPFYSSLVLPVDLSTRHSPSEAWMVASENHQSLNLERILGEMALSTYRCTELTEFESKIPSDVYREITVDALAQLALTQYSLSLKLVASTFNWDTKRIANQVRQGYHNAFVSMEENQLHHPLREFLIVEKSENLNSSIANSFLTPGTLLFQSDFTLVHPQTNHTSLATPGHRPDEIFLRFSGTIRTGTVLCYDMESGEGVLQPDHPMPSSGSTPITFHYRDLDDYHSPTKGQDSLLLNCLLPFPQARPRIAYRMVWRQSRGRNGIQRVAVPVSPLSLV